jgi:flagellin
MPATINTNVTSMTAQRYLDQSKSTLSTSMARLASGVRVNTSKDDAAGLAIAERMNAQVRGMQVAMRNASDAISLAQTAEGAIGEVSDMLQRMRELAVQAANATNTSADRDNLNAEYGQMALEVQRTLQNTKFNGLAVLGADAGTNAYQVGANAGETVSLTTVRLDNVATMTALFTGTASTIAGASATNASAAMAAIDSALTLVNSQRALYGAAQNRFDAIVSVLQVNSENTAAARGRIMDADFATETANLSRAQILQQAGSVMVAQANAMPQQVLQLLSR